MTSGTRPYELEQGIISKIRMRGLEYQRLTIKVESSNEEYSNFIIDFEHMVLGGVHIVLFLFFDSQFPAL
jgi:hypothetical protein